MSEVQRSVQRTNYIHVTFVTMPLIKGGTIAIFEITYRTNNTVIYIGPLKYNFSATCTLSGGKKEHDSVIIPWPMLDAWVRPELDEFAGGMCREERTKVKAFAFCTRCTLLSVLSHSREYSGPAAKRSLHAFKHEKIIIAT